MKRRAEELFLFGIQRVKAGKSRGNDRSSKKVDSNDIESCIGF